MGPGPPGPSSPGPQVPELWAGGTGGRLAGGRPSGLAWGLSEPASVGLAGMAEVCWAEAVLLAWAGTWAYRGPLPGAAWALPGLQVPACIPEHHSIPAAEQSLHLIVGAMSFSLNVSEPQFLHL